MIRTGRVAEAQRLILAGVELQVGGTGAAAGDGLAGAFDTLGEELGRFSENLGKVIADSTLLGGALKGIWAAALASSAARTGYQPFEYRPASPPDASDDDDDFRDRFRPPLGARLKGRL